MSPNEAILLLRTLQDSDDTEAAHSEADDILCQVLTHLGGTYEDVVTEFRAIRKWYA